MNIKKYEAFVRAVELGSLSKAAEELGYTQSGISHMMQSLEEEVGFSLLKRTSTGIAPNGEGALLLPLIRQLLADNESLHQYIEQIKGGDTGRIRIACCASVASCWLPRVIKSFEKEFPHVSIQIMEGNAQAIEQMMEQREADLCIYAEGVHRSFEWIPLCKDPLMALMPMGHPLAKKKWISFEQLAKEEMIIPTLGYSPQVYHLVQTLAPGAKVRFSACSQYAMLSMVAEGLGVSILPQLLLRENHNDVVTLPLCPPQHRTIGMGVVEMKRVSPMTRNFMNYVQSFVGELYAQDKEI